MGTSLAGLLILSILLIGSLMIWRVSLDGTTTVHLASREALQREGERARTIPSITAAAGNGNTNMLSLTVDNGGSTSVAVSSLAKMDIIVVYDAGAQTPVRLTFTTTNPPPAGQWTKTSISGGFESDVWNPEESLAIVATLNGAACNKGTVTVGFPNGVSDTRPFVCEGLNLYFHSEVTALGATNYNQLKSVAADGAATTISSVILPGVTGRVSPTTNNGKFVFPLTNINQIPAANWDLTYRVKRDKADLGFVWYTNACDISLSTTGSWQDIDLTLNGSDGDCSGVPLVPAGASGAVVEVVNTTASSNYSGVLRANGDTRSYMSNAAFEEIHSRGHRWQIVSVDAARLIEGYIENTGIDFKLLGYTLGDDPKYFTTWQAVNANLDNRVITGNDDAEECVSTGDMNLNNSTMEFVIGSGFCNGGDQELGMRFQNIPLAPGVTVSNAYIEFTANNSDSGVTNLTFYGEDIDDAPGFTSSSGDITGRTKTTASVAWSTVPAWSSDLTYRTPDLSTIIQEIIDRGSWIDGNDIVIIANGTGQRDAQSYNHTSSEAPLLHVEYSGSVSSPPDVTPFVTNQWMPVTVSGIVDADADGVILFVDSQAASDENYAIREVSSTESFTNREVEEYGNTMWLVGLNASKQFEVWINDSNVKIYLVGQTKGSVAYFLLDIPVADPLSDSWQVIDADTYGIPVEASGLVFHAVEDGCGSTMDMGFRHGDNTTDDWNKELAPCNHVQAAIGLNTANEWQQYIDSSNLDVYIAAYTRLIRLDVHAGIDVVIRDGDAPHDIVATLATDVANTANITSETWQTQTITFAMPQYTVVDQTDYLEIDLFADATLNLSGESVSLDFRIDDPTLGPLADQMRAKEDVP